MARIECENLRYNLRAFTEVGKASKINNMAVLYFRNYGAETSSSRDGKKDGNRERFTIGEANRSWSYFLLSIMGRNGANGFIENAGYALQ